MYLDKLAPGLPPDNPFHPNEQMTLIRTLLAAIGLARSPGSADELESSLRPIAWKIVKRMLSLQVALVLSVAITTIAKSWGFDLPDFFSYGIFLLVLAVIVAIIAL